MRNYTRGKPLNSEKKRFIALLKRYFDRNRKFYKLSDPSAQMVSDTLEVGRKCDFSMKGLQDNLEAGFNKLTSVACKKNIAKIRAVKDRFWEEDTKLDAAAKEV